LKGIPRVQVVRACVCSAKVIRNSANRKPRRSLPQCASQRQAGGCGIHCRGSKLIDYEISVVTDAGGIYEGGTENVGLFNRNGLAPGVREGQSVGHLV